MQLPLRTNHFLKMSCKNQARIHSNLFSHQSGKTPKLIIGLCFLSIILAILAFTPGEKLLPHSNYRGLIFDSLHFPAVWILFLVLKEFTTILRTVILILIAIVSVEIIQIFTGRESSLVDIFIGSMGLLSGVMSQKKFAFKYPFLIAMTVIFWAGPASYEATLRHEAIESFPKMDEFAKVGVRHTWEPVFNGKVQSSKITYTDNADTQIMNVEKLKDAYWGVHYGVLKKEETIIPETFHICGKSDKNETLSVRLDDTREPTYYERINIEVPFTPEIQCKDIPLSPYLDKLKAQGKDYNLQNVMTVGLFMGPDSAAQSYSITEIAFKK